MSTPALPLEDVEELKRLHQEFNCESNIKERAKRRNRLCCAAKALIRRTKTSAGLECIHFLMGTFDPNYKERCPETFPQGLWRHLESKISNYKAIERKPITAQARRERRRGAHERRQPQGQPLARCLAPAQ